MMVRWLRDKKIFPDASVDLVYLDPPFNSNAGSKCLILAGLGTPKFFKKPLASGRVFDILCAPFRLRAGSRPRWRAAASNQAEGQQLQTDN